MAKITVNKENKKLLEKIAKERNIDVNILLNNLISKELNNLSYKKETYYIDGNVIRKKLKELNMSQQQLADYIGCDRKTINRAINQNRIQNWSTYNLVCETLNIEK